MSKMTNIRKAKQNDRINGEELDWTNRKAGNEESVCEKVRFSTNLAEMFVFHKSHYA